MNDISISTDNNNKGLSLDCLKYVAIIAMFVDHLSHLQDILSIEPHIVEIMNSIGRITAPIMFYALVEGYHKTKSRKKYFLRLLFLIVSIIFRKIHFQPPAYHS